MLSCDMWVRNIVEITPEKKIFPFPFTSEAKVDNM